MIRKLVRTALVFGLLAGGSVAVASPAAAATEKHYKNCTELQKRYHHGVARKGAADKVRGDTEPVTTFTTNTAVYSANKRLDRDRDGVACEKR